MTFDDFSDPNIIPMLDESDLTGQRDILPEEIPSQTTDSVNGADLDGSSSGFNPEPNIMSSLRQPSYYFKLYVLNDLNPQEGTNEVIIAETGQTSMNITDVRIEGIVGPNLRTRNSMATSITIKLSEPLGMNLPDRMVAAARKLRIKNYLKTPFYLKLKLHGSSESGAYMNVGEWRWQLMITDVKSSITEAGADHTISAIPYPEIALQNQVGILPLNVSVQGQTVGEILTEIATALNANMVERHGYEFIKYSFIDIPYAEGLVEGGVARPFDHKIVPDKLISHNERSEGDENNTKAHFSQGTDIPSLMDTLFSASNTAVALSTLERAAQPKENTSDNVANLKPSSVFHRIETNVKIQQYDPALGDYSKEVVFLVRPYESSRIHTNIRQLSNDQNNQIGKKKIENAIKRLYLNKQYDYIFTGLNTEIEKFDMEINFRWAVSAPLFYQNRGAATPGSYDTATTPRFYDPSTIAANMAARNNRLREIDLQRTTLDQESKLPDKTDEEREDLEEQYDLLTTEYNRTKQEQLADASRRVSELENAAEFSEDEKEVILAEDLDSSYSEVQINPITVVQDSEDPTLQSGVGLPVRSDGTKSVYGTMLNQLYGSFDGNLQSIQLEIRGDPYWLGPDPTPGGNFKMLTAASIADSPASSTEAPNFMNGEHMFAFKFGLPQGFDSNTGTVKISRDEVYSGFYAVAKIEHVFSSGKFTQTLDAVRITGISLDALQEANATEEEIEDDAGLPQLPAPKMNLPYVELMDMPELIDSSQSMRFNPPAIDGSLDGLTEFDDEF